MTEAPEVREFIRMTLTSITESQVDEIFEIFNDSGVENVSEIDDMFLKREYYYDKCKPIYINKIYMRAADLKNPPVAGTSSTEVHSNAPLRSLENFSRFTIDFKRLGLECGDTNAKLDISTKSEIKASVCKQAAEHYGVDHKLGIKFWRGIAKEIAGKNKSFYDKCGKQGTMSTRTFAKQLMDHWNYKTRRSNRIARAQKPTRAKKSATVGTRPDQFEPILQPGETEESQELLREQLKKIYDGPKGDWNIPQIRQLMDRTYPTLRKYINTGPQVNDLFEQWPFVFMKLCVFDHFERLTDLKIHERITNYVTDELDFVMQFFTRYSNKNKEATKIEISMEEFSTENIAAENNKLLALIQMICKYMAPDNFENFLFFMTERESYEEDIRAELQSKKMSFAPLIVGLGDNIWTCKKFCVTFEHVVVDVQEEFQAAVEILLAIFWNFNLEFPTALNNTYDFIQRSILKLNPEVEEGTKCSKGGKGNCEPLRVKTQKLLEELQEYKDIRASIRNSQDTQ